MIKLTNLLNESASDKRLAFASKNKGKLVSKDDELFEDVIDKLIKLADKHFNIVSKKLKYSKTFNRW